MRLTITRKKTACDHLKNYNQDYVVDEVDEIVLTLISGLEAMNSSHYMA